MTKTITGTLSYRKQYALQCLLKGIDSRARDNCYEMGDGDEVVRFIMRKALEVLPEPTPFPEHGLPLDEFKKIKRTHEAVKKQQRIIEALKRSGSYDSWLYFYNHGTYDGYVKAA